MWLKLFGKRVLVFSGRTAVLQRRSHVDHRGRGEEPADDRPVRAAQSQEERDWRRMVDNRDMAGTGNRCVIVVNIKSRGS